MGQPRHRTLDEAAIFYGYGGMVNVFKSFNKSQLSSVIGDWEFPVSEDPTNLNPGYENSSAFENVLKYKYHYTNYPKLFDSAQPYTAGITKMHDRKWVAEEDLKKDPNLVEVPYRFCSDDYVGSNPWCQTWDEGVDQWES